MNSNSYIYDTKSQPKSLVTLKDISGEDMINIISRANLLKTAAKVGEANRSLTNKKIILITNLRQGLAQLTFPLSVAGANGYPLTITIDGSNIESFLSGRESVEVLSRLDIDAFIVQTAVSEDAQTLQKRMEIPVLNSFVHDSPTRALSALFSIYLKHGKLSGLTVAYAGKADKMNSFLYAASKCGMTINFVAPQEHSPANEVKDYFEGNYPYNTTDSFLNAIKTCDVLYMDNDFGEEYKLTAENLSLLNQNASVLHASPLTGAPDCEESVMDDKRCLVFNCGANTVYIQTAELEYILNL